MTTEERAEKAVQYKHSGYNCAQAVVKACEDLVDTDVEPLLKATAGFAGGMGCMESTCGALIGANMIAGLMTDGNGTVMHSRKMLQDFNSKCGALICKDLKGRDTGVVICPCDDCVRNGIRVLCENCQSCQGNGSH